MSHFDPDLSPKEMHVAAVAVCWVSLAWSAWRGAAYIVSATASAFFSAAPLSENTHIYDTMIARGGPLWIQGILLLVLSLLLAWSVRPVEWRWPDPPASRWSLILGLVQTGTGFALLWQAPLSPAGGASVVTGLALVASSVVLSERAYGEPSARQW